MSDDGEARNMLQTSVGTLGRREVVATTPDRLGLLGNSSALNSLSA